MSQNHRIVGVGRDLCGSSSPTPPPKQGHLQQAAQDLVQAGLEYLQRRRLHNLTGQPVPVLRHPQREEVPPHVQTELPVPQFVPITPCPVTGHHWKELGPIWANLLRVHSNSSSRSLMKKLNKTGPKNWVKEAQTITNIPSFHWLSRVNTTILKRRLLALCTSDIKL